MEEKDRFAVWVADAVLRASDEEFAAEALAAMARRSEDSSLDEAMAAANSRDRRPGDMGLDIIGPVLPIILVEFGRLLWDAYMKSLAEQGGKALAGATIASMKELARRTWSGKEPSVSLDEVEQRLRQTAGQAGLSVDDTERLVRGIRSQEAAGSIVNG